MLFWEINEVQHQEQFKVAYQIEIKPRNNQVTFAFQEIQQINIHTTEDNSTRRSPGSRLFIEQ